MEQKSLIITGSAGRQKIVFEGVVKEWNVAAKIEDQYQEVETKASQVHLYLDESNKMKSMLLNLRILSLHYIYHFVLSELYFGVLTNMQGNSKTFRKINPNAKSITSFLPRDSNLQKK